MHAVWLMSMLLMSSIGDVSAVSDTTPSAIQAAQVWYLGSNGWAVQIGDKFLIFDYQDFTDPDPPAADEARDLRRGYIDPVELSSFDVYVFVTHSHQDHFDPVIFEWDEKLDEITYVFGWKAGDRSDHHYMVAQRAHETIDGVEVYTIYSHHSGVPEVAYLVIVNGCVIYHNGDYKADYLRDYEYLRTITDHIDICFVIGHPDVSHQYFKQTEHLDRLFRTKYMFPMNREGESYRCDQFSKQLAERGVESRVVVLENRGDNYECRWSSEGAAAGSEGEETN
jgi:L-ascorbate metabolism protein UlaG (beta-lactamase superfamily)